MRQTKLMDKFQVEYFQTLRNADARDFSLHLETIIVQTLMEMLYEATSDGTSDGGSKVVMCRSV